MKPRLLLQILLFVAAVFLFLVCPFGCQSNEGDVNVPLGSIPFPHHSYERHLYVEKPSTGNYLTYARSDVTVERAERFLREFGFTPQGEFQGPQSNMTPPDKVKTWWDITPQTKGLRWSKKFPDGFADAFVTDGRLYLFSSGDYRAITKRERKPSF